MDLLSSLESRSLDQLLTLAAQRAVPIQSRISRCIIISDFYAFILKFHSPIDNRGFVVNSGDTMGRNLALEVGVDIDNFPGIVPVRPKDRPDYLISLFVGSTRSWLREQGIFEQYLGAQALLSAVATVIYERKLRTPEIFWTSQTDDKIFFCSLEDFRSWEGAFKDETPDDYIWEAVVDCWGYKILTVLYYQKMEVLLTLARSFPPRALYFETRVGLLDYLSSCCQTDPQLESFCLDFLSNLHGETYPGRRALIKQVYSLPKKLQIIPSYINDVTSNKLLAIPPVWYEEQYFRILLTCTNLDVLLARLRAAFPLLNELEDLSDSYASVEIFRMMNTDPKIQPKSRSELAELVDKKIFRRISPTILYSLTGWRGLNIPDMRYEIKDNLQHEEFHIITNVSVCPTSQDYHLNPYPGFAISFGRFTNFVCYSPEDLIQSFRVDPNFVAFRKPDKPNEAFSQDQIDSLYTLLSEADPNLRDNFTDEITPLLEMIGEGLAAEYPLELDSVIELLSEMTSQDRKQAEVIFRNFFEAGMFQRTWNGIGKYPLKYNETHGSSLGQIEIGMTPCLNNIQEAYDKLSKEGQGLIRSLAVVDYIDGTFIRRVDPLLSFETQTREGNFCIGYGSRLMIYSGYFYLSGLGLTIPEFSLEEFEPESTHR